MSASQKILFSLNPPRPLPSSPTSFCRYLFPCKVPARSSSFVPSACGRRLIMPRNQKRGNEQKWIEKPKSSNSSPAMATASEVASARLGGLSINDHQVETRAALPAAQVGNVQMANPTILPGQKAIWKPRAYGTASGGSVVEVENESASKGTPTQESSSGLTSLFRGIENFSVDSTTYARAQVRATFYPKFENEKSDQEIRTRMAEVVSKGLGTLEVSLKHSGSLFMYAGNEGGAYAKNSFGNIYTAVGVFVLGRMIREAWGAEAGRKQAAFNEFLEKNRMCISMELVTAVLGDHGQRPREDYVVVTAVTELGKGKPRFYSTPEIIAFCRKWRLPTNHVWLFSSRKSVAAFFATYDALCEEGTATTVCRALDQVADISVPGSKDHIKVQGEILEGLVARVVSHESSKHLEDVLKEFPLPPNEGAQVEPGPSLREICAANRSYEKQQVKALLKSVGSSFCPDLSDWLGSEGDNHSRNADRSVVSKFLQSLPADYSTTKLQEMIRLMREKRYPAAFKCYHNYHMMNSLSSDNLFYKMVIHVHSDSAFRRYQRDMRYKPELWPLYRGFFVDINLFKATKERAAEISKGSQDIIANVNGNGVISKGDLADDDANLMIKLKFLTYKIRTFLIRNGLSTLFKDGPAAYKAYYQKQMKNWGTSYEKQRQLSKMLDEWAVYIRRKCGNKQLSSSVYLSEAEPFLEQYAKRSPENQALIGSAGNLVRSEDFLAIVEGGRDEEGDLYVERESAPPSPGPFAGDSISKDQGLIVFFPGIPGCAKSALCKELLSAPGGLGDDRPLHSLMGDLIRGRYWPKVAEECRRKPKSIMLADKNAPNEEVWRQIEDMCRSTRSSAVPVVPDSEGTDSNPFALDALAIFMFRVLQRTNHPGNLDKNSPSAGYVLLMFYHLYEGKSRKEFDNELLERFGSLVKIPLLKPDREPLPDSVKSVLEEGISLYNLHTRRHGRLESTKGSYAKEWSKWEMQLRSTLSINCEYLNSVQVPFEVAVKQVQEQLKSIARGEYKSPTPSSEKRKFGSIVFAAVSLPVSQMCDLLKSLAAKDPRIEAFLKDKQIENSLKRAHVTLAHKRSHGVTAVAGYGIFLNREVPVEMTALLYDNKMAAFEARLGSVDGENVTSKNEWPHITLWTDTGIPPKEANNLPQLFSEGKATRIEIDPPVRICGPLEFF